MKPPPNKAELVSVYCFLFQLDSISGFTVHTALFGAINMPGLVSQKAKSFSIIFDRRCTTVPFIGMINLSVLHSK